GQPTRGGRFSVIAGRRRQKPAFHIGGPELSGIEYARTLGAPAMSATTMTLRIKSPQDVGAAIILIAIGVAGLWFGRDYDIGSVSRMGPGYLPVLLSIGLLVFGAVIGLRAVTVDGPPIATGRWYPSAMVLAAVLMFAMLIER